MKVLLFGATGMVGQGVLRECLLDPDVTSVVTVVRKATGRKHEKLAELVIRRATVTLCPRCSVLSRFLAVQFRTPAVSGHLAVSAKRAVAFDVAP